MLEEGVEGYGSLYRDSKTKVVLTSQQTRSLIKDQQENNSDLRDLAPQS